MRRLQNEMVSSLLLKDAGFNNFKGEFMRIAFFFITLTFGLSALADSRTIIKETPKTVLTEGTCSIVQVTQVIESYCSECGYDGRATTYEETFFSFRVNGNELLQNGNAKPLLDEMKDMSKAKLCD